MSGPKAKRPVVGRDFLLSANKVTRSEVRAVRRMERARSNIAAMLKSGQFSPEAILAELDDAHGAVCLEFNLRREE